MGTNKGKVEYNLNSSRKTAKPSEENIWSKERI
jgi:hypothetical protein